MSLDEDGSVTRWYKTENRTGYSGQLYSKFIADVSDPKPEATTTWPPNTEPGRCFVLCSQYQAYYIVAEDEEDKK